VQNARHAHERSFQCVEKCDCAKTKNSVCNWQSEHQAFIDSEIFNRAAETNMPVKHGAPFPKRNSPAALEVESLKKAVGRLKFAAH